MSLETLKDVKEIDGHEVIVMDELRQSKPELFNLDGSMMWEIFEMDIRPNKFIYVRHDKNSVSFTIQNGPIKENGLNGCQLTTLVETALIMLRELNKKFPCRENALTIMKWEEGLLWQRERTRRRSEQGIEGTNNETI